MIFHLHRRSVVKVLDFMINKRALALTSSLELVFLHWLPAFHNRMHTIEAVMVTTLGD